MEVKKTSFDEKEQLRIWMAVIHEKHRKIENGLDRLSVKEIGWLTPSKNEDVFLYSV